MKVRDHLSKEQQEKLKKYKKPKYKKPKHKKKKRKRKPEQVDWHDLMGMNRDTYKRGRGGAYRSNKK
jgi:hypothetical protein